MKKNISRRRFLKSAPPAAAGALLTLSSFPKSLLGNPAVGPRVGLPNPYVTPDGRPYLVCVEGDDFDKMFSQGMDIIGGLEKLVGSDQDVLIKPNWNYRCLYPGISSPSCLRTLACEVGKVTSGAVAVGDQGYEEANLVYGYGRYADAITGAGAEMVVLTDTYDVRADHWMEGIPDHQVYQGVYDAPVIINTCCLKRHHTARMTCALKNNVGAVAGPSALSTRAYLHSLNYSDLAFQSEVAEIANLVRPELNVVDARAVLTVSGPVTSAGVVVNVNKIVICGDMVATDTYCADLLAQHDGGFSPAMIYSLLTRAEELGLGTADLGNVEIIEVSQV